MIDIKKESENYEAIVKDAKKAIEDVSTLEELENTRVEYLGKKGIVTLALKTISTISSKEDKTKIGSFLNTAKKTIHLMVDEKKEFFLSTTRTQQTADLSLPPRGQRLGSRHPISSILEDIEDFFSIRDFSVAYGPEIEDEYHNFEGLNIPKNHPARAMHDTFYLENGMLLRTHTSSVQVRVMNEQKPPIRIIAPGRVFRRDSDATHTPMFHQVEGLYIDENVSFPQLKGLVEEFLRVFFNNQDLKTRFRPSYFPFTEPSAEVDIRFSNRSGKQDWLEVMGCGMVHPNVLKMANINPEKFNGYAFGMGVERLAMLRHDIKDLRVLFDNDPRFLEQF